MKTIAPHVRLVRPPLASPASVAAPERSSASAIDLRIDEVVLHGVTRPDAHRVADALRTELTRLVAHHGLPGLAAASASPAERDAGEIRLGTRPETTGLRAARAIYGSLRA